MLIFILKKTIRVTFILENLKLSSCVFKTSLSLKTGSHGTPSGKASLLCSWDFLHSH